MYENLVGKKLLVIGSGQTEVNIVNTAHNLGVYAIVADGIKKSSKTPAKNIADESWDIDYSDIEAIGELCKKNNVDGVIAGYSEFRVLAACRIANYIGTPFYGTVDQIDITRDKRLFKDECKKYNIPIPCDYCYSYPVSEEQINEISYPVIVKPTDYAGRKGITVCFNKEELMPAIEYAYSFSKSGNVIIEDYIVGTEISSVYSISNGEISLSCFNEKYLNFENGKRNGLCDLTVAPSDYYNEYISQVDGKIRDFLNGIEVKNGVAFFQGIAGEKGIYIFEMGYRLNGNNDYVAAEKYNGISYMKMLISHSLTGDMTDDLKKDNPIFSEYNSTFKVYVHAGVIGTVSYGNIESYPGVESVHICSYPGTEIIENGSTQQMVLSFKLAAKTMKEIAEIIDYIQDNIVVEDVDGNNMLFNRFDTGRMLK